MVTLSSFSGPSMIHPARATSRQDGAFGGRESPSFSDLAWAGLLLSKRGPVVKILCDVDVGLRTDPDLRPERSSLTILM